MIPVSHMTLGHVTHSLTHTHTHTHLCLLCVSVRAHVSHSSLGQLCLLTFSSPCLCSSSGV